MRERQEGTGLLIVFDGDQALRLLAGSNLLLTSLIRITKLRVYPTKDISLSCPTYIV